jgi:hypothetical protein
MRIHEARPCVLAFAVLFCSSFPAAFSTAQEAVHAGGPRRRDDTDNIVTELVQDFRDPVGDLRAPEAYARLFSAVGVGGIAKLQNQLNDSIALQAAWEEVAESLPDERQADRLQGDGPWHPLRPDQNKLHWFLGFLQGRAHVNPPKWWSDLLFGATAVHRRLMIFELPENSDESRLKPGWRFRSVYHNAGWARVTAPPDTTLTKRGKDVILRVGRETALIPEGLFDGHTNARGEVYCGVSATMSPSRCHVVIHEIGGFEPTLVSIDRETSKVVWKSEIWGSIVGGSFFGEEWLGVTEQGDRVVVFECRSGLAVEAFRSSDGANRFRFSTTLSEEAALCGKRWARKTGQVR